MLFESGGRLTKGPISSNKETGPCKTTHRDKHHSRCNGRIPSVLLKVKAPFRPAAPGTGTRSIHPPACIGRRLSEAEIGAPFPHRRVYHTRLLNCSLRACFISQRVRIGERIFRQSRLNSAEWRKIRRQDAHGEILSRLLYRLYYSMVFELVKRFASKSFCFSTSFVTSYENIIPRSHVNVHGCCEHLHPAEEK